MNFKRASALRAGDKTDDGTVTEVVYDDFAMVIFVEFDGKSDWFRRYDWDAMIAVAVQ